MTLSPLFPFVHPSGNDAVRLWVFPGQGSQSVGMGQSLYNESPTYRDVFNRASQTLLDREGVDIRRIIFDGPKEELTRTLHAQPALLIANLAFLEHLKIEEGIGPQPGDLMAGHSVGEWTAYAAAGSLTPEQGALAVYWRGRLMEQAFPFDPTTRPMTAILKLSDDAVVAGCAEVSRPDHIVVAANFNNPGQVVISGHPDAVLEASQLLKSRGASVNNDFPVAGPFHTPILNDARDALGAKIRDLGITFATPRFRVLSNFTGREIAPDADHLQSLLNQLTGSVRWSASMVRAWELGAVQMVSVDVSGSTLQGFAKKIFSREVAVQTVDPTIPMHVHALRTHVGTVRATSYPPSQETATLRSLEFSYDAGSVASLVKKAAAEGDFVTALLVLKNRNNRAREAGMRELQAYADRPEVIEAMQANGFADKEGVLQWPAPVELDLPIHALPDEISAQIQNEIFTKLAASKLAPIDPSILAYYIASRWGSDEERLKRIMYLLRRLAGLNATKLGLTKYNDENGEEQKGIDSWDKVILYVDTNPVEIDELDEHGKKKTIPFFPHPGAMTQGDCE